MTGLLDDPVGFLHALLLKIPALLLAVTVHEVAHALVADRLGDRTARQQGRLTLNPLPHLDPVGALAFVLAGFGWARPVQVNAANLRNPARDMVFIAAAGPASNFVLAFLGIVAFVLAGRSVPSASIGEPLAAMLLWVFQFNLALAIFNVIPLPPLDGGHFLRYMLREPAAAWLGPLEQYGPIILLVLVLSGATRYVVEPVFRLLAAAYISLAGALL
jgi:Zn-dependent protease